MDYSPPVARSRWGAGWVPEATTATRTAAKGPSGSSAPSSWRACSRPPASTTRYYPLFLTLARTGCRPGEALALRWMDVNFQTREILIERALSAGRIGATKTGRSRRADDRELAAVLGRLRKETRAPAGWVFLSR